MLENRVIARLPRAMMAALSTAIGRWVITRSSLPLHLASKIPEPPLKARRAVITRSFFVSTAFNLNRPPPPPPSIFSRVPFLSLPTRKLGRFISSSNNLSSISFLPSYSRVAPRDRNPLLYPTDHDSSSKTTCYYGGSPVMDVPSMERVDVIICSFYDRVIRHEEDCPLPNIFVL